MRSFFRSRVLSFKYAFEGWWHVLQTQRNAWIHALASITVVIVSIWLRLKLRDWALIVIAIALVWISEFLNTALEAIIDLVSPEYNQLAKLGKDVSAATVLVAACTAVLIGLLVLGPPLWAKLFP